MTNKSKAVFSVNIRNNADTPAKNTRIQGFIPANIYGLGKDSQAIQLDGKTFSNLYHQTGDSGLAYLKVGDSSKEEAVLIDEVQRQPVTNAVIHVNFRRVNLAEKIRADIAIELEGENDVPEATIVLVRDTLEVEALPTDLPDSFSIDISQLTEIGQNIAIKDLKYDHDAVEIILSGDMTEESPLVILQEVKEEEEVDEETSPDEVELVGEGEGAAEATEESAESPDAENAAGTDQKDESQG